MDPDQHLIDFSESEEQNSYEEVIPSGEYVSNITAPSLSQKSTPTALRPLNHFLKLGHDHLKIDHIISYWCYYYAVEKGLILDKSTEGRVFIDSILKWLECQNIQHRDEDAIVHNLVAEAYIENYILNLMLKADDLERSRTYDKNTVKLLYTVGFLCETLKCFHDEMSQEFLERMNYSKWRAAYIHNCLKKGETPKSSDSCVQIQEPDTPITPSMDTNIPISIPDIKEFTGSTKASNRDERFEEIKLILQAKKFATIAASSLDFKDIGFAKDMLQKALGILEKINPKSI